MAQIAPDPIDVQDFQFILQCRLKIFSNDTNDPFNKRCSLLATASRFGLVFVGTISSSFEVIQLNTIEEHSVKDGEVTNYKCRTISLPSSPQHLDVNCDCTRLAVIVEQQQCCIGLMYDIPSMMKQVIPPPIEIRLSPTPGVGVIQTSWNSTIPNVFTACKDDGTLGLYELKETGIELNELPAESQATCMCWSPKGKQIAVGSRNGKITQYKPDLKAMKVVNPPPIDGSPMVVALQWISNFQFIAVYKPENAENSFLMVVNSPKTGDTIYTNYDDICFSYGSTRPIQFYTLFQPNWNILMVASSNSMEVGVLGNENVRWILWTLPDSARAELPLSNSKPKQETLPIGLAFNTASTRPVVWGETSLPAAPYLLLLSHHGALCCFRVINVKSGVISICQQPELLADTSGLNQFIVDVSKSVLPETNVPEVPKQLEMSKPKPAQPLVNPLPNLPQVSLFPKSTTSPFASALPQTPVKESGLPAKSHSNSSLVPPKQLSFNFDSRTKQQPTSALTTATTPPKVSQTQSIVPTNPELAIPASEIVAGTEELDVFISQIIREECDALEAELKTVLHKGKALKIDLGTDTEAVDLVRGADALEEFLKDVNDTSAAQAAEVHMLKQGLIQTWAWYEDARSRFAQTQDESLEILLKIQQLDPVSQRYLADIKHMTYYLNSQLIQAVRVLDEQWENFQDSCKNISKLKVPTMEAIYQTMVRHNAIQQKQEYVLKDISNRIRVQRRKVNGPSLLVSLKNVDQLSKELSRLQLEPEQILQAQYNRVAQAQQHLTTDKVQKLGKILLDKEMVTVTYTKPKIVNSNLQAVIQAREKSSMDASLLGAGLSPITKKPTESRVSNFIQSTPKVQPIQSVPIKPAPTLTASIKEKVPLSSASEPLNAIKKIPVGEKITPSTQFKIPATTSTVSTSTNIASAPNQANFSSLANAPMTFTPTQTSKSNQEIKQFGFSNIKPSSTSSTFTPRKPSFNFSFQATTSFATATTPTFVASPLATANSAFVPTTQVPFSFTAQVSTNSQFKPPAFSFSNTTAKINNQATVSTPSTKSVTVVTSTASSNFPSLTFGAVKSTNATSEASIVKNTTSSGAPLETNLFKTPNADSVLFPSLGLKPTGSASDVPVEEPTSPIVLSSPTSDFKFKFTSSTSEGTTVTTPSNQTSPLNFSSRSISTGSITSVGETTITKLDSFPSFLIKQLAVSTGIGITTAGTTNTINATTITPVVPSSTAIPTTSAGSVFISPITVPVFNKPVVPTTVETSVNAGLTSTAGSNTGTAVTSTSSSIFGAGTIMSSSLFGTQSATTSPSLFGPAIASAATTATSAQAVIAPTTSTTPTPSTISTSLFTSVNPTTAASSIFNVPVTSTAGSIFGAAAAAMFGSPTTTATTSAFGQQTFVTSATGSLFSGQSKTDTFGSINFATTTNAFGGTTNSNTTSTAGSLFGQPPAFGSSNIFGGTPASTSSNASNFGSIFGTANTAPSIFGQSSTSSFSFKTAASAANIPNAAPAFGFSKPNTFSFGGTSATADTNSFSFGNLNVGSPPAQPPTTTASSGFGSAFGANNANPFAKPAQAPEPAFGGGGSLFGTPTTTASSSIFGGGTNSNFGSPAFGSTPSFGATSPFGQQPAFGQNVFGGSFGSSNQAGPFSGGNQSVSQTGFGSFGQQPKPTGFGAAPVFGGSPSGFGSPPAFGGANSSFGAAPVFGTPPKPFGSPAPATGTFGTSPQQENPTFANLATQNTLGFGSLAQQTQPNPNMTSFSGGSSFSTWR